MSARFDATATFDVRLRTRVVFGAGAIDRLGELAAELGFRRTLLVADPGLLAAGFVERATDRLRAKGVEPFAFHDFDANPDSEMARAAGERAREHGVDSFVGLGGGSSLDCAKAANFLLTGGGRMQDYWGYGQARRPLRPMIGVPTTAGTGSEAQTYALVSDAATHVKMACGDPTAAFRVAILDPLLTVSQPAAVAAAAGYDALSHAVETFVCTRRNPFSETFSREAWRLLEPHFARVIEEPSDLAARGAMLLGAHYAGVAIEASMLGAAHACANPLTARYGTVHGVAIALMLPSVCRWNGAAAGARYGELLRLAGRAPGADPAEGLAVRLADLAATARLPARLREMNVPADDLQTLAGDAAVQWTGRFNPRPFDAGGALELYRAAW
ncbi:MAG TPA: iron-containing alcohol dehydrogenase [Vicinamibacteria bacterium]|nr:iron-containing alcohol dehydrogenase [Vicinamibacteria bacterium]